MTDGERIVARPYEGKKVLVNVTCGNTLYFYLTPDEARRLASALSQAADVVETSVVDLE